MDNRIMQKVLDKVPEVVAKIKAYEADDDKQTILEIMRLYSKAGKIISEDKFALYDTEMIRHIRVAKQKGFEVSVNDDLVTVKRTLSNGEYYLVEYRPITA